MRIEMDNKWSATELGSMLTSLSDLYSLRLILDSIRKGHEMWESIARKFPPLPSTQKSLKESLMQSIKDLTFKLSPTRISDRSPFSDYLNPDELLEVRRVKYSSPGVTDLTGVGAIVGHLKDFILRLIEHRSTEPQRNLENELRMLKNERIRIENAKRFLALLREQGVTGEDMKKLISYVDNKQDIIVHLVATQKITGVYVMAENATEDQHGEA
jgi:hypothetical protein